MSDADDFLTRYLADITRQYASSPFRPDAGPETVSFEATQVVCRDGVSLTTDIFRPSGPGPYPTIVVRCPYPNQVGLWKLHGTEMARRGYALVRQWCRGTHTSQGTWEPNVHEREDGRDLLDYLERQSWVRVIGLWGTSYLSLACWLLADIPTPKVVSICANHYGTDRFASAYQKGSFRSDVLTAWAMQNAGHPVDASYEQSALHRPQMDVDVDMWGGRLDWYRDWISHPNGGDAYWGEGFWGLLRGIPARVKVPMFIQEGWFDHHLGSSLIGYETLAPEIKEHSWLRIGCWNHYFLNALEGLEPPHLNTGEVPGALEWFDLTLKRGITPERKVEYYAIGTDMWHEASSWPVVSDAATDTAGDVETDGTAGAQTAGAGEERLYLGADVGIDGGVDGSAIGRTADLGGVLTAEAPSASGSVGYDYDPDDPVPTRGGEALLTTMDEIGARVQPEVGYRPDVLSFVSGVLDHDLHIQGKMRVELYVSSSAEDTAFTAKLIGVDPDGTARNYRSSITTIAMDEPDAPAYRPGDVRKVTVEMWDICWDLPAGSRLRCDVSSSDFPQYAVHTNTAGLWSEQDHAVVAHQRIHCGGSTPSCVVLPVTAG
ncbi:CocE/NonD family hydrolase [Bifidobacterium mongoliense]|uniref:CocE/NonD family hydrolase n=1 Tax=Bifidobacterium mongoliense TaxID=518643 RepID=UPI0030EF1EBD